MPSRNPGRGPGVAGEQISPHSVGPALDHLVGTWSEDQAREIEEATAVFERVEAEDLKGPSTAWPGHASTESGPSSS
jgi:hypothetical protein